VLPLRLSWRASSAYAEHDWDYDLESGSPSWPSPWCLMTQWSSRSRHIFTADAQAGRHGTARQMLTESLAYDPMFAPAYSSSQPSRRTPDVGPRQRRSLLPTALGCSPRNPRARQPLCRSAALGSGDLSHSLGQLRPLEQHPEFSTLRTLERSSRDRRELRRNRTAT
jgi:hypothetical protein